MCVIYVIRSRFGLVVYLLVTSLVVDTGSQHCRRLCTMTDESTNRCTCLQPMQAGVTGDPLHTLLCSHTFHLECLTAYMDTHELTLDTVRCPQCRLTAADVTALGAKVALPENSIPDPSEFVVTAVQCQPCQPATVLDSQDDMDGATNSEALVEKLVVVRSPAGLPASDTIVGEVSAENVDALLEELAGDVDGSHDTAQAATRVDTAVPPSGVTELAEAQQIVPVDILSVAAPQLRRLNAGYIGETLTIGACSSAETIANQWNNPTLVWCADCNTQCDVDGCRLMGKQSAKFRCKKCASTFSKLYNGLGGGSTKTLAKMPAVERMEFMKLGSSMGMNQLKEKLLMVEDQYSTILEEEYDYGGEFKPLSVWQHLGYDVDAISRNSLPKDIAKCRLFGTVHRVPTFKISEKFRLIFRDRSLSPVASPENTGDAEDVRGQSAGRHGKKDKKSNKRRRKLSSSSGSNSSMSSESSTASSGASEEKTATKRANNVQDKEKQKVKKAALKDNTRKAKGERRTRDKDTKYTKKTKEEQQSKDREAPFMLSSFDSEQAYQKSAEIANRALILG